MQDDERVGRVKSLLTGYVRDASLRQLRDPLLLNMLAREIIRTIDGGYPIWKKWDAQREQLLQSAVGCWVPIADLCDFLNTMPGPHLTITDVAQRMKVFEDASYTVYPREEFQAACVEIYQREKADGTELSAIIGLICDHVEREEERIEKEEKENWRQKTEEYRLAREQHLLSGADCGWTLLRKSRHWHCRTHGRLYRLSPTKDKKWNLYRVQTVSDQEPIALLGTYRNRVDATKAVAEMAYLPEAES